MKAWHIAQLNVARAIAPLDSPQLADFMAALDRINALAESSPGFVWRLKSDDGNATDIKVSDDPNFIINMSVWESVELLFEFVYRSSHTPVMARRREWFEKSAEAYQVMWWIPAGHVPTAEEAMARLRHLRENGPTPHAFTFRERHPAPDEDGGRIDMRPEPSRVGRA
ncbi:DUF3291 domain-containing protein [Vitiosangium sp. GDMCC 1.1324]|uniref:DUF3291 domain-containing protein n=1 Tax=Vitiosangium sp. (strain GDMCC 1.1324) TaxID=2138576 RepID=UPI000D36D132|nr:DUF3291 domain-containing protein [Vitiosangium sp. GDMCC 1.1324]PTL85506.1 DUF3291 domain-containing protein [Vitiosangium sp. GDMCC 1.1324]